MIDLGGKELVLAAHPRARVERHKQMGPAYFVVLIYDAGANGRRPRRFPSGKGDTAAQAWNDAADRLDLFPKKGD